MFNSVDYTDERAQATLNLGAHDIRDGVSVPSVFNSKRRNERDYGPAPVEFKRTIQSDPRFPNQNLTKWCWMLYIDYHRCLRKYGEDYKDCDYYKWGYNEICPMSWIEKFDDQRSRGIFPAEHMIQRQPKGTE